jgi:biopolymer transport protein TolQ
MFLDSLILPIFAQGGDPNILTYFTQSNFAGKIIILLLMAFSMVAWTIMISKYLELNRMQQLNHAFDNRLKEMPVILNASQPTKVNPSIPYSFLYGEAATAYFRANREEADRSSGDFVKMRMGHVENALQRGVSRKCSEYEGQMVFLATIVTGAPFMGLLGTVWGVMDAFGAVALRASATLQMLAPGVSGALMTTVAGLLVAIPSVFGYNILLSKTKRMMTELENYASHLADRIELENT